MSRLDRRGRDPHPGDLRGIEKADVANRTIVPFYVHGALRVGKEDISLNRAYQRFGISSDMQQFVNRWLNPGGVSKLFGANPKIASGGFPGIPGLEEAISAVFARFTDPLTEVERNAIFRFVFMNYLAGNWQLIDEFYCFPLSGANKNIGWIADPGGVGAKDGGVDGKWFVDNVDVFQTNTNPILYEVDPFNAFVGYHSGKQMRSTFGAGATLVGGAGLSVLSNGPLVEMVYELATTQRKVSATTLGIYQSSYAARAGGDITDFYKNGVNDGSTQDNPPTSAIGSILATVRMTTNGGNCYTLSATWGRPIGFNFETWHAEEVAMFTALGAYSAPPPSVATFTGITVNSTILQLAGVQNAEALFEVGDTVHVKSDDATYNTDGLVTVVGASSVRVDIPYTIDAGPGTITQDLQPTP